MNIDKILAIILMPCCCFLSCTRFKGDENTICKFSQIEAYLSLNGENRKLSTTSYGEDGLIINQVKYNVEGKDTIEFEEYLYESGLLSKKVYADYLRPNLGYVTTYYYTNNKIEKEISYYSGSKNLHYLTNYVYDDLSSIVSEISTDSISFLSVKTTDSVRNMTLLEVVELQNGDKAKLFDISTKTSIKANGLHIVEKVKKRYRPFDIDTTVKELFFFNKELKKEVYVRKSKEDIVNSVVDSILYHYDQNGLVK